VHLFDVILGVPDKFLWGAATAAHQVEGGNWNNDWWAWEHDPASPCVEPSGDACDHWHRWPDDLALLLGLGFKSYRFSLEWSRIEVEEGEFSTAALDHYRRICAWCRESGLEPVVVLHHTTNPRWVAAGGGWSNPATADQFARYAERVTRHLGDLLGHVCTINEPSLLVTNGYQLGIWPPGQKDGKLASRATDTYWLLTARRVDAIRGEGYGVPVGLAVSMTDFHVVDGAERQRDRIRRDMEDRWLEATDGDDFLGVQVYTRTRVGPDGVLSNENGARVTLMGYEFWPEAIEACLRRAWEVTDLPLLVSESGIGTSDDTEWVEYVDRALRSILRCLSSGIEVRGYIYWSLLDNFEWNHGYCPTFGLVAVDRITQERTVKASGRWLGQVARTNTLAPPSRSQVG
jgi:beta-glucosidase